MNLLPNDYLAVTLVLVIICAILNITSLFLGIPALIFSITVSGLTLANFNNHSIFACTQAYNAKGTGKYMQAKTYGNVAMGLNIANIVYTLVVDALVIGLTIGLNCGK